MNNNRGEESTNEHTHEYTHTLEIFSGTVHLKAPEIPESKI